MLGPASHCTPEISFDAETENWGRAEAAEAHPSSLSARFQIAAPCCLRKTPVLQPKGQGRELKIEIARQLRVHTPMTRRWIANRLQMGSASNVSKLTRSVEY